MKLHLTNADGQHLITAFEAAFIAINHQKYHRSMVLMPTTLMDDWLADTPMPHQPKALVEADFEKIAELKPEVVLLGTGKTHQFLHPKLYQALTQINVAVECMTTAAACRTYNILMSEGRNVAAALILEH
jgi:uncharacterized protein